MLETCSSSHPSTKRNTFTKPTVKSNTIISSCLSPLKEYIYSHFVYFIATLWGIGTIRHVAVSVDRESDATALFAFAIQSNYDSD